MARRQVSIVRCDGDGCKEYAEVEDTTKTPDGWYQIRIAGPDNKLGNAGFDLHSLRCVERWAKGRKHFLSNPTKPTVTATNGTGNPSNIAKRTENESMLMDTMQSFGEQEFTVVEITEYSGLHRSVVNRAVNEFTDQRLIERTVEGFGPNPSKYRWIGEE